MQIETYCYFDNEFKLCDPRAQSILLKSLPPPVRRGDKKDKSSESDVSNFFGILVQIQNDLTFKLVDKLDGVATGTVCTKPSGLATHRDRLRKLYAQIPKSSPIHTYLFKDASGAKSEKDVEVERTALQKGLVSMYGSASAPTIEFTDISQLIVMQVCIYMDFLLRWLDYKNTDGKRWFLRLTDSARSGIVHKK
jgi:hypothetical protein